MSLWLSLLKMASRMTHFLNLKHIAKKIKKRNSGLSSPVNTAIAVKALLSERQCTRSKCTLVINKKVFIVQKYIEKPLLVDGRKFDIRWYGLLTSINGRKKGYFYQGGYLRTSSAEFDLEDIEDKYVHLTNDAIQSRCEEYGRHETWNKLSFLEFEKYLEQNHKGISFYDKIYPKIK